MTRWLPVLLAIVTLAALASVAFPVEGLGLLARRDPALLQTILVELRLPRTLLALLYGAILGASGAAIQALFANPLASPDVTGATSGAALGSVVTAYLLELSAPLWVAAGGIAGAGLALALLLLLAGRRSDGATILLAGVAISALTGAGAALTLALAPSPFAFYEAYDWLMGSLVDRSLSQAALVAVPVIAMLLVLLRDAPGLDTLALGETAAAAMGHDVAAMRRRVIIASAIGVGAAVAVCGAVGFIGLVAPVLARRLTAAHPGRAILPAMLIGAALLCLADLGTRFAPVGRSLPVGVLTALIGAPFFLTLVVRMRMDWR